jgi:hypothetical protein
MKTLATIAILLVLSVCAAAEPVHINFTSSNYAGAQGVQTFSRAEASINRTLSWEALDDFLDPFGMLTYNNNAEGADGIGMVGKGNYASDEIEGSERARLRFNESVNVTAVDFTDFFDEVEPSIGNCPLPGCYLEVGALMFYYGDGTHSLWNVFNAPSGNVRSGNGVFELAVSESNVVAIVFAALGWTDDEHHEYSVAGVTVDHTPDTPQVPEPASLLLVGSGVLWFMRNRRKHVDA